MSKPNTIESVQPLSGHYSWKQDLRLNAWFVVAALVYGLGCLLLKRQPNWSVSARAMISLAPLVPGLLYIRSGLRFVRGMDELQRRIQLEAWLFAALGTLLVEIVINIAGASGIHLGLIERGLGVGQTFTLTFALWLVGSAIAHRRYQ